MEFVLWLPILLFVTALMVNYGTLATWRVRGEVVSRHAAWRARWPRSGNSEGAPREYWPRDAEMDIEPAAPMLLLDDPAIQHPVVRGPIPNDFIVNPVLDPDHRGAYQGVSEVNREYPLLPRLGDYRSGDIETPLLDRKWQAAAMGIPNRYRRIKVLYQLPKTDPSLPRAFANAVNGVLRIPHFHALAVLDRYPDVLRYTGSYHDFHPLVDASKCELDRDVVRNEELLRLGERQGLVDRRGADGIELGDISRLPRGMTGFFLRMYRAALRRLQDELAGPPPPSPRRRAEIQAEIAELQRKIGQLEAYQGRIPAIEDSLRASAAGAIP